MLTRATSQVGLPYPRLHGERCAPYMEPLLQTSGKGSAFVMRDPRMLQASVPIQCHRLGPGVWKGCNGALDGVMRVQGAVLGLEERAEVSHILRDGRVRQHLEQHRPQGFTGHLVNGARVAAEALLLSAPKDAPTMPITV